MTTLSDVPARATRPQQPLRAHRSGLAFCAQAALALLVAMQGSGAAWAQNASSGAGGQPSIRQGEPVTLNFENAEIEAVARAMATITGRNVVVDPRVRGTINLVTGHPVSAQTAMDQFMVALRMQGFTMVEAAGLYKVVPEADAKLQTGVVNVTEGAFPTRAPTGGQIVTQIFRLQHENAANLVPTLRPLISPNNTINVNPGTNALVITDYADNLSRIARIVAALDVSNASDIDVIPLQHAIATDLAVLVNRLIEGGGASAVSAAAGGAQNAVASGDLYRTAVLADSRSNSLVVRAANPARAALVRSLVARLDRPTAETDSGNIHVVYLRNADAVQLAGTLRAAIAADPGFASQTTGGGAGAGAGNASGGQTSGGGLTAVSEGGSATSSSGVSGSSSSANPTGSNLLGGVQQTSTGGQIQADPVNNALIISAPAPLYRQMRAVIDQLDTRRAQIYVEALIAEVAADNTSALGVQWLGLASDSNGYIGGGTNFGTTGNLVTNAANYALENYTGMSLGQGMNIGLYKGSLAVLASALETKTNANILSTPTLLTLDNQEAKITIGQNVPVATGSYSTTGSSSTVNPYTTYERMDVGLVLNIRPQINADGTIKLQIYQEVSSISGSLGSSTTDSTNLVTNKRTIASTVLVQDGNTAVLGGLIQDQLDITNSSVPVLGDLPLIGGLFRSQSRSRSKTNLMVFLRPVILQDSQSMDRLALDRYDMIRTLQIQDQPRPSSVLSVNTGPVLPEYPNAAQLTAEDGAVPRPLVAPFEQPQPAAATPAAPAAQLAPAAQPAVRRAVDIRDVQSGDASWGAY
ncbi:type II secretion system protein GspD [Corticibacter populi]|uniref:Type II secretion system protein GspD n=1 Tax=Corticibacter populi TaxID=1550736 RepID=A0A3M6QJ47_9BURK|nr:type II secretion system secretin GspD [Corticibacter populi]RMX02995.1 type II secretion system protein GspD [Corticibacter populi]